MRMGKPVLNNFVKVILALIFLSLLLFLIFSTVNPYKQTILPGYENKINVQGIKLHVTRFPEVFDSTSSASIGMGYSISTEEPMKIAIEIINQETNTHFKISGTDDIKEYDFISYRGGRSEVAHIRQNQAPPEWDELEELIFTLRLYKFDETGERTLVHSDVLPAISVSDRTISSISAVKPNSNPIELTPYTVGIRLKNNDDIDREVFIKEVHRYLKFTII